MKPIAFSACFSVVFACAATSRATTYYVATTGDDTSTGTSASAPLKTIQRGVDLAKAGDVVEVSAGTYAETVHFTQSGADGAPITVRARAGDRPTISPGSAGYGFLFEAEPWRDRLEIGWLSVDGFEIVGADAGIELTNAHHIHVSRCWVHGSKGQGVLGEGHDVVLERNLVTDNGDPTITLDHGMYLTGQHFRIVNNVIRNNASYGIQVAAYGCYATSGQCAGPEYAGAIDWLIAFNTIAFEGNRSGIVLWDPDDSYGTPRGTLSDVRIVNNVFYDDAHATPDSPNGVDFVSFPGDSSIVIAHNLFFSADGNADLGAGTATISGSIDRDPLFVDAKTFDFHLTTASPAVDVGASTLDVFDDYDGVHRPQGAGFDLGAFEFPVAAPDAGSDTPVDAPSDTRSDASFDVGADARADAPTPDASLDASSSSTDASGGCSCTTPCASTTDLAPLFAFAALFAPFAIRRRRSTPSSVARRRASLLFRRSRRCAPASRSTTSSS